MINNQYNNLGNDKLPSDKSFGLLFSAIFIVISIFPLVDGGSLRLWAMPISALFLVISIIRPATLHMLNVAWFRLGRLLGHVVGPVFMAAMYFIVITPIGIMMRLSGSNSLALRRDPTCRSYWIERTPAKFSADSMRRPY